MPGGDAKWTRASSEAAETVLLKAKNASQAKETEPKQLACLSAERLRSRAAYNGRRQGRPMVKDLQPATLSEVRHVQEMDGG